MNQIGGKGKKDIDVPVYRSCMRSVVDEESDTVNVMTIDDQITNPPCLLRIDLPSTIETAPVGEVLGELELLVTVVQI